MVPFFMSGIVMLYRFLYFILLFLSLGYLVEWLGTRSRSSGLEHLIRCHLVLTALVSKEKDVHQPYTCIDFHSYPDWRQKNAKPWNVNIKVWSQIWTHTHTQEFVIRGVKLGLTVTYPKIPSRLLLSFRATSVPTATCPLYMTLIWSSENTLLNNEIL